MEWVINENTSVIPIDGSTPAQQVIYISNTTVPDHFATVIDMTGVASQTNPIQITTADGVTVDGGPDLYIRQPFGYLSLTATSQNSWAIVNRDPFSDNASTIRAMDALSIHTDPISSLLVSTNNISASHLHLSSANTRHGFIGNNLYSTQIISVSTDFYSGHMVASTIRSATANMQDTACRSAAFTQGVEVSGQILFNGFLMSSFSALNGDFDALNANTIVSTMICDNVTTRSTQTSTITGGNLYLGATSLIYDEEWIGARISTPSTILLSARSDYISTPTITATNIYGNMSTMQFGSAAIRNPFGSILLDALSTNVIVTNDATIRTARANNLNTSNITMNAANPITTGIITPTDNYIVLESTWDITANRTTTGTMNTENTSVVNTYASTLIGNSVIANTLAPTSFRVSTSLTLEGPSFNVPLAPIAASKFSTLNIQTAALHISSLSGLSSIISDSLSMPGIATADISAQSISTIGVSSVGIQAQTITLGKSLIRKPNEPYVTYEVLITTSNTPPYQYVKGAGTFTDPLKIVTTFPTIVYVTLHNPSGGPLYLNTSFRHTNLPPPNSGLNGGLDTFINGNTHYTVLNIYQQPLVEATNLDMNMENYPIVTQNPITNDDTPYFAWNVSPNGVTTDELTLWVSNNTNADDLLSASTADENAGIRIYQGILTWPSTIYGTSIVNSYNDIQTRSLFYTGALQNISDRALKRDLGAADLSECVAALPPLHTYRYRPEYASTFHVEDRKRLGILTTELAATLPKSVTSEVILGQPTQVANTDQMRYAHLGATKYLIAEVQRLRQKLLDL